MNLSPQGMDWSKRMNAEQWREHTFHTILELGMAVIHGGPDERVPAPYSYTVGRSMHGRPEILITGMEPEPARELLNEIAFVDDVLNVTPGETVGIAGVQLKFMEADPRVLFGAVLQFGVDTRAIQAMLPDANGEYPDTLRGRTSLQPVMPVIREDAWDPYDDEEEWEE